MLKEKNCALGLVLLWLFNHVDSKVEYRFPLSFKGQRKVIFSSGRSLKRKFELLF